MPTKRNRKDSERSVGSVPSGFEDDNGNGNQDFPILPTCTNSSTSSGSVIDEMETVWQRPCCMPTGCLFDGQVNLTEPKELVKILCTNENCTMSPYMHKECFIRWEDGLLTYLRSHGRARSWSEKQRRQNLWTKKGYDLAFRACGCMCGRGHLRRDVHWNPQDVAMHFENGEVVKCEEGAKKKNRKKHKDLPVLGNKYSSGTVRSKSKPIPNNKEIPNPIGSNASVLSVDQGYSSSSPANTEINGGLGSFIFSPPHHARQLPQTSGNCSGLRNHMGHAANGFLTHTVLTEIPDNHIVQDFCGRATAYSSFSLPMSPISADEQDMSKQKEKMYFSGQLRPSNMQANQECANGGISWPNREKVHQHLPLQYHQDQRLVEINKMMDNIGISRRSHLSSSEYGSQSDLHSHCSVLSHRIRSISESTTDSLSTQNDTSPLVQSMFDFDIHHESPMECRHFSREGFEQNHHQMAHGERNQLNNVNILTEKQMSQYLSSINQQQAPFEPPSRSFPPVSNFPHEYLNELKRRGSQSYCPDPLPNPTLAEYMSHTLQNKMEFPSLNEDQPQVPVMTPLPENHISMMYNNMDPEIPQVIVIPGEKNGIKNRTFTEIRIIPMRTTTFKKRYNFDAFQDVLQPSQINPYHIKMEGEGYGSDDLRNFILSKLSTARCSQMNCVICSADLPIYDHFPLLDGTMFLSPERNEAGTKRELKMEVDSKCEYVHAVCMRCLEGLHNIVCRLCKTRWHGSFHQLGSLYMFDIFAANPCCQHRLCCKQCGKPIVDRRVGLKYFSEYSAKMTCSNCRTTDHHFVHPTSTYQLVGLVYS